MPYEIYFLPVGDGSRAGDSILVRYGDPAAPSLMVIDGGNQASGEAMVDFLYGLNGGHMPLVHDLLVSHPDADHASGALEVLKSVEVLRVHTHRPWRHARNVATHCVDLRRTENGIRDQLIEECPFVFSLVAEANQRGIPVFEPFQGATVGPFWVMSPHLEDYPLLLAEMLDMDPWRAQQQQLGEGLTKAFGGVSTLAAQVLERWGLETLRDGGQTSARNEMSTVLYGAFGTEGRVLLTADAGLRGLGVAADYADMMGMPLGDFNFVQVPHHGSRRNVGPRVLDRLIGPRQLGIPAPRFHAYISAPKDDAKHPRKVVVNAFRRRGALVAATQGMQLFYRSGFPSRAYEMPLTPLPFYPAVEAYD
jgi:beta-lactamase superfamily II metal-dependent hydrolase